MFKINTIQNLTQYLVYFRKYINISNKNVIFHFILNFWVEFFTNGKACLPNFFCFSLYFTCRSAIGSVRMSIMM